MADDRTPRRISLTERPSDEDVPRRHKRRHDAARQRRQEGSDQQAVVAGARKGSEQDPREHRDPRLL